MNTLGEYVCSPRNFLERACAAMNEAVCAESRRLSSGRMGTTAVVFFFTPEEVYLCNIGDSRAYRLRDNELLQLSEDHLEHLPQSLIGRRKPGLTQYLGVSPEEMIIEPYIAKGELQRGDLYLLCSDGLTDMLSNLEISVCLSTHASVKGCVEELLAAAVENGGKDNITAILIRIC